MQPKPDNLTEVFETRDGHAFWQLAGCVTLEQATDGVTRALLDARNRANRRLLVDGSKLTGFPSPSVADRYFIVRRWVTAASGLVELSLVLQQHLIDPDRFGIMVATNLGMRANVFSSAPEAQAWLLSGQPGPHNPKPN